MKIKAFLATIILIMIVAIGLISCNSQAAEQNAQASRLQAEAELARAEAQRERVETDRLQAEAEAYQRRTEAATLAEVERAAIRQAERNASHERIIETLPFLVLIVGVVAIGALAVIVVAGRQRGVPARDPELTWLLQQQAERLAELERATYHQIAMQQRQQLGVGHQVIVYDAEGRMIGNE